jgi:16S rRNA (cytosine967-C5)-methyltransferase
MNKALDSTGRFSPRQAAVLILNRIEEQDAFAEPLLDHYLSNSRTKDERDRGLITQLVFGTLRMRGYLDWIIGLFYRGDPDTMATGLKNILRTALFQLRFMDRLPPHAVVNEAVKMTESAFRGRGALVNAILRNYLRKRDGIALPDQSKDAVSHLAVACSHPRWLLEKWIALFGEEEAECLCHANNVIPPVTVRINTLKTSRQTLLADMRNRGWKATAASYAPDAVHLIHPQEPVRNTPWYCNGEIHLQDEGSQLISQYLDPQPGEQILDLCAGTGGKTTQLAALMCNRGRILALDNLAQKLEALQNLAFRMGATIIEPLCCDGRAKPPAAFMALFDRVLVDAPCTGTGTLRRNPEIKWRLTPEAIPPAVEQQRELLDGAVAYLKQGGTLVYSTCSLLPEENEDQIAAFLTRHPGFHCEVSTGGVSEDCIDENGFLKTFPHRHNTDGFFAALLRKRA